MMSSVHDTISFVYFHFIEKYQDVEDLGLKWDLIKMEIRGFTVKFSKTKTR